MEPPRDFEAFCRIEWPRLVRALVLYTGDVFLAEELAQEALTRVAGDWERVAQLDAPGAWGYRVALNLARSHFRRIRVARRARERMTMTTGAALVADPGDAVAVRAAVAALPERQRRALVLRYWLDLPVAQVADIMRCPDNTVKTLTRRALIALRGANLIDDDSEVADVP